MLFAETPLVGAYIITLDRRTDPRGFFARTACQDELAEKGLNGNFVQQSISWNPLKGTVRGMHFQAPPHMEDKLVRVTRGAAWDVFLDMRPDSPTRGQWYGVELTADNRVGVYIPRGFAHGYQILEDNTEVFYQMTERYQPTGARGIRWDDEDLAISWPLSFDPTDRRQLSEADSRQPGWAQVREAII